MDLAEFFISKTLKNIWQDGQIIINPKKRSSDHAKEDGNDFHSYADNLRK